MASFLNLPGLGGSGDGHWQTLWEAEDPAFQRFEPSDWDRPALDDWRAALDRAAGRAGETTILVAHSLACLLVAKAGAHLAGRIRGAFLVALPDPDGAAFPDEAAEFRDLPASRLPFPTLIVASTDDPYGSVGHARRRAHEWDAGILVLGARGHINADSGLDRWSEGRLLLDAFRAGLRA